MTNDRPIFECTGCGVVTSEPAKQMELYRAAGKISCCPEREMVALGAYQPVALAFPRELTDDLRDVLSIMIWQSGDIARCLRAGGVVIKTRAEDEQAYVLHWLTCLALEHGSEWRAKASDRIAEIRAAVSAKGAADGVR